MVKIEKNFNLLNKTTWHLSTYASAYVLIQTTGELQDVFSRNILADYKKHHILGSGANTLFAHELYDGIILEIDIKGKEKVGETETSETWRIGAGEDWIQLVDYFVKSDLGGLENLAYIPGRAGAAPVQNIAAYGKTFEDVCNSVTTFDLLTGKTTNYSARECGFGYRTSIFKETFKSVGCNIIITDVTLILSKPRHHKIENSYYSLSEKMTEVKSPVLSNYSIQNAYDAVVAIRKSKLPDHTQFGTNGSLFVNPIVTGQKLKELLAKFPRLQYYPAEKMQYINPQNDISQIKNTDKFKIAAGHIFDTLGWKGKRVGRVGTWDKHALVLCSYGATKPKEILDVIELMQSDFESATGIHLEPEINIIR